MALADPLSLPPIPKPIGLLSSLSPPRGGRDGRPGSLLMRGVPAGEMLGSVGGCAGGGGP